MHDPSSILISCLHTNTPLCLALGKHLETQHGRRVHFISDDCPSSHLLPAGSLVVTEKSHHPGAVDDVIPNDAQALFDYIYARDRFLKRRIGRNEIMVLFRHWSRLIRDYLEIHQVGIVIIEGTPAYELLLEYWARKAGARIVCPAQIVWGTETGSVLYSESIWSHAYTLRRPDVACDEISPAGSDDKIFNCTDSYPNLHQRLKNFFARRSLNSPTRLAQLAEVARKKLSTLVLRMLNDNDALTLLEGDVVTYFLHVDPEKSVDNSGSDIWPQMAVIKDLRNRLPQSTTLVVRDHPQIRGKRLLSDVHAIRCLPHTLYVTGQCDRMALIKQSRFVCTISGSVALESAMRGAHVAVYGRPLFLFHPRVIHIDAVANFHEFGRGSRPAEQDNAAFARYITPRMAKFVFGDIHLMSSAMSGQNISNLANAILDAERLGWGI